MPRATLLSAAMVAAVSLRLGAAGAASQDVPVPGGTSAMAASLGISPVPERARFVAAAREAWASIDRPDLIAKLDKEFPPAMYMPFAQELPLGGGFVIRADTNIATLATAATRIVRRVAPTVLIGKVRTIAQIKDENVAPRRLNAALVSSFGILAVIIAAVGIAGVLAFSVSARTNEIGIRMSLGADRGRVQRMILKEGGVLVAIGLVLGVAGSFFAAGVIQGLLFGVAPRDPITLLGVAAMMAVIGIVACWIPARRAARVDPAIAMRAS